MYPRRKRKDFFKKIAVGVIGTSLLMLAPVYATHAESITFTPDTQSNWQFTSGFHDNSTFYVFTTSDGRGSSGSAKDVKDTSIPVLVKMEVLIADTHGGGFSSSCATTHFTGDATTDLACYAAAATQQGYAYNIATTPILPPPPCKCP